jgi:nucleoside phosphorylase
MSIALFAASEMEYHALRKVLADWQPISPMAGYGSYKKAVIELYCTGMGPQNATAQATQILERSKAQHIVVGGFAGSLSLDLNCPDVVIYEKCGYWNGEQLATITTDTYWTQRLLLGLKSSSLPLGTTLLGKGLTLPQVVCRATEKATLGQLYQANAVDMESYQILQVAQEMGRMAAVIRVISDDLTTDLPDLNAGLDGNGRPNNWRMAWVMAQQPRLAWRFLTNLHRATAQLQNVIRQALDGITTEHKNNVNYRANH